MTLATLPARATPSSLQVSVMDLRTGDRTEQAQGDRRVWARATLLRAFVLILASLFVTAVPCEVLAKPTPAEQKEARERYKRGLELYREGASDQALLELERAYELAPAFKIQYNIAQVAISVRDYARAIRSLRLYLEGGGRKVPYGRRLSVKKELKQLEGRVGFVVLTVDEEDAVIKVDDVEVGISPLAEPLMLNTGRRVITAQKDGARARKVVVLAGKDEVSVTLELVNPDGGVTLRPRMVPVGEKPKGVEPEGESSYVWAGWLVTGGLAAGAVAAGLATFLASRYLDGLRETKNSTIAQLEEQREDARVLGVVADALIGASVIAGAIALYFTIDEATGGDDASVEVGVSPTGVVVLGHF